MAGGPKGFLHGARCPDHHVGGRAHRARNDDRLACCAVGKRDIRMSGTEGTRRPFPVYNKLHGLAFDHMLLDLGDVVSNIIQERKVSFPPGHELSQGIPDLPGYHLSVTPGKIGGCAHGREVLLSLRGVEGSAGQLAIGKMNVVLVHGGDHLFQVVGRHLVSESPRARMDEYRHLIGPQAKDLRHGGVEDLFHIRYFHKVVAGADSAQLIEAPLAGKFRYPLDVKVILVGERWICHLLYNFDADFRELFKVKADFDSAMPRTEKNTKDYARFCATLARKENLLPLNSQAIARLIEYGSRISEDQEKLSTRFRDVADVIREAHYYCAIDHSDEIDSGHIRKAIEQKLYRSNLLQQRINEMIENKQILIDINGEKIGQVNGLSVIRLGDIEFGVPSRITCSTSIGKSGVIAIEREARLSGPIHTKGVMILTGYLTEKFVQDKPLSLTARIVFEQSYSPVEGDSASSTELYCVLSALAGLPVRQGIAVTGSVNQKGQIQAIGGVNEKIEGYYEVCKRLGSDGSQGIIIPSANIRNLMLKEEIREAVKVGTFRLWAIDTIEEGIEILTGIAFGSVLEPGTVAALASHRLDDYAEKMKTFLKDEDVQHYH